MTTTNEVVREAELRERITPQLVNLDRHSGSSWTITVLLDGRYFTVERARPDFPAISDDAALKLPTTPQGEDALRTRRAELVRDDTLEGASPDRGCEFRLISSMQANGVVTFGYAWRQYRQYCRIADAEPTTPAYHRALRRFTEAWLRLDQLLQPE
jgi:hypothetical protein